MQILPPELQDIVFAYKADFENTQKELDSTACLLKYMRCALRQQSDTFEDIFLYFAYYTKNPPYPHWNPHYVECRDIPGLDMHWAGDQPRPYHLARKSHLILQAEEAIDLLLDKLITNVEDEKTIPDIKDMRKMKRWMSNYQWNGCLELPDWHLTEELTMTFPEHLPPYTI